MLDALFATPVTLPSPKRERWQPLRSGVLNLYRYDYEEFHFEDGRLLLRGNNGSGKSRVLALQLPFLLDGEVNPARVEPDGDAAKRIEWNLLMGKHADRTGYTWIEFGRREPDGTEQFVTLGCGLRAVAGQSGLQSRWFFTTTRRVGLDLFLQTPLRQPLGRDRLQEAMGADGRVFTKAEDYRRAVDDALFGLGARYGALLELLLRLRRPQLSRKLDEEELSNALSDALPTLSSAMIDEVAESFRSMQADRDTLREFTSARDAVGVFLRDYAGYVRIAVRRRAASVRSAHSAYEAAQRAAREAEARLDTAVQQLALLATARASLELQLSGVEAAERTLRESPEMRTAEELDRARETAEAAAENRRRAEADEQQSASSEARARESQAMNAATADRFENELEEKLRLAEARAVAAEFAELHRETVLPSPPSDWTALGWASSAELTLRRALSQRERALHLLRDHEKTVASTEQGFASAEAARRRAEDAASLAREAEHNARETLESSGHTLLATFDAWRSSLRHLQPPHRETWSEGFGAWLERREGQSPLRRAIEFAYANAIAAFADREASLRRVLKESIAGIAELDTSIERLEQGDTPPPEPPLTRKAERTGRAGAPLWRVIDFRPEILPEARAGLESALQAAGLLDAWILPDGQLLDPIEDTFLFEEESVSAAAPFPLRHLGETLIPVIDEADPSARTLTAPLIERLLRRIGLGAGNGAHWMGLDGSWQLGPLSGRWTKSTADYIGESTRAAARRRQLEALRARRAETLATRDRTQADLAALARDQQVTAAERESAPSDEPVLKAGYGLEAATRAVADTFATSERADRESASKRTVWEESVRQRDRDAADLKLTAWVGRIDQLAQATQQYVAELSGLWPTIRHWETLAAQLAALREQTAAAEVEHATRRARREVAAGLAEASRQRFETMQAMHGQEISVVLDRLRAATLEVSRLKGSLNANQTSQIEKATAQTRAEEDRKHAEERRGACEGLRRTAIESLQLLAERRLLAEADPQLREIDDTSWVVSRAVEIARQIEPLLADTADDDDVWRRRQDAIHGQIQDLRDQLISHGHQPETHQVEDLIVVSCVFQARPHTMTELRAAFAAELDERQRLLEAKEREIIENHLLAEVAVEIQRLIRAAETWRGSANTELMARPTSSGVRFRFQWEAETEIRFHDIRPVLLRKGELWTPAERTALAQFLQERIRAEQATDESGSWRDHLAKALDYRRWHRFVVERQQDGQWKRLDKRTYGTGSGGEKALALTLPRFAAAAAHYRSAGVNAPRLIMLDEAFAGIDPTMRAQCMGVLTQFDLDVVMTSELEWGCYATVPALAIYHLTSMPGVDAVAATRWVWNGRSRRQEDLPLPLSAPPQGEKDLPTEVEDESAG